MTYDPAYYLRMFPANRWVFRWGFEFAGNKAPKVGGWFPASRFEDMASAVNKDGLVRAYIEGKHWTTREVKTFAECLGVDFINFEHLAVYISQANGKVIQHVYGMKIQTRNSVIICLEDGSVNSERRELGADYLYPEWTRY
jgi:hypothetical protein